MIINPTQTTMKASDKKTAEEKQGYVCGFMFTNDCKNVILIRKNKPLWQSGKLNGVGGKIKQNESPFNAMNREYREEAGIDYISWNNFLTIEYKSAIVYFFRGFSDNCFYQSETKEAEIIEKIAINKFPFDEVIPNLNWIINLALDPDVEYTEAVEYHLFRMKEVTDGMIEKETLLKSIIHEVIWQYCYGNGDTDALFNFKDIGDAIKEIVEQYF